MSVISTTPCSNALATVRSHTYPQCAARPGRCGGALNASDPEAEAKTLMIYVRLQSEGFLKSRCKTSVDELRRESSLFLKHVSLLFIHGGEKQKEETPPSPPTTKRTLQIQPGVGPYSASSSYVTTSAACETKGPHPPHRHCCRKSRRKQVRAIKRAAVGIEPIQRRGNRVKVALPQRASRKPQTSAATSNVEHDAFAKPEQSDTAFFDLLSKWRIT